MEKNSIRILSLLGSAKDGGAENFFDRLTLSLNQKKEVSLQTVIRKNNKRYQKFVNNNVIVNNASFFNHLSFITHNKLKKNL